MLARGRRQQNGAPRGQKTAARAREGVEHELYEGVRAQKPPLPGKRPGLPPEPEPRGGAVTVGYVAAPAPPLAVPLLASAAGEAVDHSTLQFLLKHAIEMKKALEEEERRKKVEEAVARLRAKVHAGEPLSASEHAAWYGTSSSSIGKRRKKKKRKRRKLPKAPLPRCGRPCDLQRQVPAALRVLRVPRQNGGHSCSATETGTHSVLLGPGAVLGQGRCAGVVQRLGYGQTVQKTVLAPQLQFRRSTSLRAAEANPHGPACSENHRDSAVAVGQVAGRAMPAVVNDRCLWSDSAENCGFSAVAVRRRGRRHLCRGAETVSMVLFRTIEILQLQYTDKVIDVPVVPVLFPSAGVEKTAELPRSSWTRWLTCPCVQRQVPMTQSTRLWTSLCSCSDKFPAVPGGASELFIDKMFKF